MARLRRRPRADGGTSYQGRWVLGGGRAIRGQVEQTETFTSKSRALAFKAEVEEAGHQWPTNVEGIRWTKGLGYVSPIVEVTRAPSTFHDVAVSYFEYQARMTKLGSPQGVHPAPLSPLLRAPPLDDIRTDGVRRHPTAGHRGLDGRATRPALGRKSIRNRRGLLFSILKHGQKRLHLRPDNPAELTRRPSKDGELGRQVRFFQHGERALLRSCLKSDVHLMVDIALATGLRWGEIAALRREDLSFPDIETVRIHGVRAWSKRAPDEDGPLGVTCLARPRPR